MVRLFTFKFDTLSYSHGLPQNDARKKAKDFIEGLKWGVAYLGRQNLECQYYTVRWLYSSKLYESAFNYGRAMLEEGAVFSRALYFEEHLHDYEFFKLMGEVAEKLEKHEKALGFYSQALNAENIPLSIELEIQSLLKGAQTKQAVTQGVL